MFGNLEQIVTKIKQLKLKHLIITWGEPLLFQDQIELIQDELIDENDIFVGVKNVPIIWYEDLFSSDRNVSENIFNSIGLNLSYESIYEYINPSNRYRK